MTQLTRERLLGLTARRYLTCDCPELGQVTIQSLNEQEAAEYQSHVWTAKGEYSPRRAQDQRRRLIALMLVAPDAGHTRLLRDEDVDALRSLDNHSCSRSAETTPAWAWKSLSRPT